MAPVLLLPMAPGGPVVYAEIDTDGVEGRARNMCRVMIRLAVDDRIGVPGKGVT